MLSVGDQAPVFELPNADMQMVNSANLKGKSYVVYFYPKDDTPGCTIEAQEFTDLEDEFSAADTLVFGVSKDDCVSHGDFRDKFGLTVCLLADVEGKLSEAYGVWQEKQKGDVKKMGIVRSTFIIDQAGMVKHALRDIKPKGHAAEVLALIKGT